MSALRQCAVSAAVNKVVCTTRLSSTSSLLSRTYGEQVQLRSSCKSLRFNRHRGAEDRVTLIASAIPKAKEDSENNSPASGKISVEETLQSPHTYEKEAFNGYVTKPPAAKRNRFFQVIGWLTYLPGIYIVISYSIRYYQRHF